MASIQQLWTLLKNGGAEFLFVLTAAITFRENELVNLENPDIVDWFVILILAAAFGDAIRRILSKIIYEEKYKHRQWQHERDNYEQLYLVLKEEHKKNGVSFKALLQEGSAEKLKKAQESLYIKTLLTKREGKKAKLQAKISVIEQRIANIEAERD